MAIMASAVTGGMCHAKGASYAELEAIALKLSALDDEEAELLRRLASGELSPEEEAAIRARLEEIAEERAALLEQQKALLAARNAAQAAARQKQLDLELGELQRKLKLLDDEEAELLRRLQEGNLTPEEEAAGAETTPPPPMTWPWLSTTATAAATASPTLQERRRSGDRKGQSPR